MEKSADKLVAMPPDSIHHHQLQPNSTSIAFTQQQYARLGLNLLAIDSVARLGASGSLLNSLLSQLSYSVPCVNACAATLGVVYKSTRSTERDLELESLASSSYHASLRLVREELNSQLYQSLPLVMACLFLVAVEVLLEQPHKALIHLQAAHQMLLQPQRGSSCEWHHHHDQHMLPTYHDLEPIFQIIDLQTSSFKWDYCPRPTNMNMSSMGSLPSDLASARNLLLNISAAATAWLAHAFKLKYFPASQPRSLLVEQGRHVAALSIWLEQFHTKVAPIKESSGDCDASVSEHALTLRMTCMSLLIRISNVLEAHETSYDNQTSRFRQIILDAERILAIQAMRKFEKDETLLDAKCVIGLGIIEPLFLVAQKYRDALWRRRALGCLSRAGLELPFNGPREAAIAQRIIRHEEHCSQTSSTSQDLDLCSETPDSARLHGCRISETGFVEGRNKVVVTFFSCKEVDGMHTCTCADCDYDTLFSQTCHWQTWDEEIQW